MCMTIAVQGIRKNHSDGTLGTFWTKGGKILIDGDCITLHYLGTLAVFHRKNLHYYRDTQEELLLKRILRLYDEEQDFSVIMYPSAFEQWRKYAE